MILSSLLRSMMDFLRILHLLQALSNLDTLRTTRRVPNLCCGVKVNQLLDLSKLEAGKMTLKTIKINIIPFLKGLVFSFASSKSTVPLLS